MGVEVLALSLGTEEWGWTFRGKADFSCWVVAVFACGVFKNVSHCFFQILIDKVVGINCLLDWGK